MRRQGQYADSGVNPMISAQMQHMSVQRAHHNSGMDRFPGRPDSSHSDDEYQYMSSKSEGQWAWDRDGPRGSNQLSSHAFKEGPRSDASRSLYQGPRSDSKLALEKHGNANQRSQGREEEIEVGYGDNTLPQSFEGLEHKFLDEIMKLTKEQQEAEDAENARHREKLSEINAQYQEKILAIRARQATQRDEYLQKELQVRRHQYQQVYLSTNQNSTGPSEPRGFGMAGAAAAAALAEANRAYAAAGSFDSYREKTRFHGGGARGQGFESRGSYPGDRVYDSGARYF